MDNTLRGNNEGGRGYSKKREQYDQRLGDRIEDGGERDQEGLRGHGGEDDEIFEGMKIYI